MNKLNDNSLMNHYDEILGHVMKIKNLPTPDNSNFGFDLKVEINRVIKDNFKGRLDKSYFWDNREFKRLIDKITNDLTINYNEVHGD